MGSENETTRMRRPVLLTTLGFSAGIIMGHFSPIAITHLSLLLLGSCVLYLIAGIIEKWLNRYACSLPNIFCWFVIILSGWLFYEVRTTIFPSNHIVNHLTQEKVHLIARIIRDPDLRADQTVLECSAESLLTTAPFRMGESFAQGPSPLPVTGKIRIFLKYPTNEFEYGDRILAHSKIWFPEFPQNPNSFDYRAWLERRNIYGVVNIQNQDDVLVIDKTLGNPFISKLALPIKRFIRNTIDTYLTGSASGRQAGFLKAITIGEKGMIPKEVEEYFRNTGVIHILVISGLHIGIIAFIIFQFLGIIRIPWLGRQILTSVFLLIYMCIAGFRYPIVRATIMTIIGMFALTTERNTDMSNIVSSAALIILFLNPQSLFDVSFQLSFIAVMSIVYLSPKLYGLFLSAVQLKNRIPKYCAGLFITSLSAQLGLIPIIAYYFSRMPVISIIANLFVIPLAGLCIALTFAMSIFNLLPWHFLANILAGTNWLATTFMLKLVKLFSKIPYAHFWVQAPSILFIGFIYLLLISGMNWQRSIISKRVFIYGLLIGLNILIWSRVYRITHSEMKITCLSVGSTFVESQGYNILIDGGDWSPKFDEGENIVAPFLRANGVQNINLVIATSPKICKIGGLEYIIANFKVKEFRSPFINYPWTNPPKPVVEKKVQYEFIDKKTNSLKLSYGNYEFLFPMRSKNEVLWLINKGSPTDTEKIAIVREGHPCVCPKQLNLTEEGAVIITTDGKAIKIETMKALSLYEPLKHRILRYTGL